MSSPAFVDADLPQDSVPPTTDVKYPCEVCGKESGPYGGRGRKPKKCPEHKIGANRRNAPRATGTNSTLATQATEALCQINGFLMLGVMFAGMHATAGAFSAGEEGFRGQTYAALLTDPDLCRSILKAGVKSGKLALIISYLMLAGSVIPTAVVELREKKAEREARKAELEQSS